jgi:hypothetical protein
VLPTKKDKLREKVLKRSMGSKPDKKKKQDDVQSAVSNQTDNSVERRREEEQAKVTSEFAMAQIFE